MGEKGSKGLDAGGRWYTCNPQGHKTAGKKRGERPHLKKEKLRGNACRGEGGNKTRRANASGK